MNAVNQRDDQLVESGAAVLYGESGDSERNRFLEDRRIGLRALQNAGYITYLDNLDSNIPDEWGVVVNISEFTKSDVKWNDLEPKLGDISSARYGASGKDDTRIQILARIFHGTRRGHISTDADVIQVFSTEDYARFRDSGDIQPRPLFYVPRTADDAADIDKVQNASYHLGFWQLGDRIGLNNPTLDGTPLKANVVAIGQLVHNKQFGAGVRRNGVLFVRWDKNEVEATHKMSTKFFRKWGYNGKPTPYNISISNSPIPYLNHCPELTKSINGQEPMLKKDDFRSLAGNVYAKLQYPNSHGLVHVEGTHKRYTLGAGYSNRERFAVQVISDGKYAVLMRRETRHEFRAIKVLDLRVSEGQAHANFNKKSGKFMFSDVPKKFTRLFGIAEFADNDESVRNMLSHIGTYRKMVAEMAAVGVRAARFDVSTQARVYSLYKNLRSDNRFWKLLSDYSSDGLSTLLTVSQIGGAVESVLNLQQNPLAQQIFTEISHLSSLFPSQAEQETHDPSALILRQMTEQLIRQIIQDNEQGKQFTVNEALTSLHILRLNVVPTEEHHIESRNLLFERKTFEAFIKLKEDRQTETFLPLYAQVLEKSRMALEQLRITLAGVTGAERIYDVAKENINKQTNVFLTGTNELLQTGQTTISVFGKYLSFTQLEEIQTMMGQINTDMTDFLQTDSTYKDFKDEGLKIIGRYIFDFRNVEYEIDPTTRVQIIADQTQSDIAAHLLDQRILRKGNITEDKPDIIVVSATSEESLRGELAQAYQKIREQMQAEPTRRPSIVIVHANGFSLSSDGKTQFPDAYIATDEDKLRNMLQLASELAKSNNELFNAETDSPRRAIAYSYSQLKKFEEITANTFQTAIRTIKYIQMSRAQ